MKTTVIEGSPYIGLLTHKKKTFCFSPDVLATANQMPIMTMSIARDSGEITGRFSTAGNLV